MAIPQFSKRTRKIVIGGASTALMTAVSVGLIGVSPAHAGPGNCSSGYGDHRSGYVICTTGTGSYKASVKCDVSWGFDYQTQGPWMPVGSGRASVAACKSDERAYNLAVWLGGPIGG